MDTLSVLIYSGFGSIALQLVLLAEWAQKPKSQRPAIDLIYLIPFLIFPILGCFIAIVYYNSGITLTPILAVQIGASAPAIIKSLAAAAPSIGKSKVD